MSGQIRIALVDDQRLFVESLKVVIESRAEDIHVVAIGSNGQEAVEIAEQHAPDLVLMDIRMPVMDGVAATREIHRRFPDVKIMILSTFSDDTYARRSLQYGAMGYLLKSIPPEELIGCIRGLCSGTYQISPAVAELLIRNLNGEPIPIETDDDQQMEMISRFGSLSNREKEVLKLVGMAYDNRQIAERLFIAEQTVRNYISSIYSKLGVASRVSVIQLMNSIAGTVKSNESSARPGRR